MRSVIINAICAILLMLVQSNIDASFGISITCEFGIIAALCGCALIQPTASMFVSMLAVGLTIDAFASGPSGLYALIYSIACIFIYSAMMRFRTERVVILMIYSAIASCIFEFLLSCAYMVYYEDVRFIVIFLRTFLWNAIVTAIMTPLVMTAVRGLDKLMSPHRSSGLIE